QIGADLTLTAGNHVFYCSGPDALTIAGILKGAGALTKLGAASLKFISANTYSGLTTIGQGELRLEGNGRPGSTAAGTSVEVGGSLYLVDCSVTNETLTLHATPGANPFLSSGTNRWKGAITLDGQVQTFGIPRLTWDGVITGNGGVYFLP